MTQIQKWICLLIIGTITTINCKAQDAVDILEKRANELHLAIVRSDEALRQDFIEQNYSRKMLEDYGMDKHLGMFERLHNDFAQSEITSLKIKDDKLYMAVERKSDGHRLTFVINYDPGEEFKFDGFSIEAGEF